MYKDIVSVKIEWKYEDIDYGVEAGIPIEDFKKPEFGTIDKLIQSARYTMARIERGDDLSIEEHDLIPYDKYIVKESNNGTIQ